MEKLKPCPFCGSEPQNVIVAGDREYTFTIFCRKCGDVGKHFKVDNISLDDGRRFPNRITFQKVFDGIDGAIKEWNRRTERSEE